MVQFKRFHCIAVMLVLLCGMPGSLPGEDRRVMILLAPTYPSDGNVDQEFPDQFVFYDHETLDIVLAYRTAPDAPRIVHRIERPPRIAPKIRSEVSKSPGVGYRYRYTVTNGPRSAQPLRAWLLSIPRPLASDHAARSFRSSSKQGKSGVWRQELYAFSPGNWSMRFTPGSGSTLLPDQSAVFSVDNEHRPGVVRAYFHGAVSSVGPLPADVPLEARKQLEKITSNWGKTALWTIGPKFKKRVTSRSVAADFHVGISRMLINRVLDADSPFVQRVLDRLQEFIKRPRPWDGIEDFPRDVFDALAFNEAFSPIQHPPDPRSSVEQQLDAALKLALVNP